MKLVNKRLNSLSDESKVLAILFHLVLMELGKV